MKNLTIKKTNILFTLVIILVIIIVVVAIFLDVNKPKIKNIEEDNYFFQYDNTWKIVKKDKSEIELHHKKSNSIFNIKINDLGEVNQYKTIDEILDNLIYNIQEQNNEYKLIYKQETKLTKNEIDGYIILFEDETTQVEISLYKQGNKIILFKYEALFEYFDILKDSVNNIIYNFSIKEKEYNVVSDINLNTTEVTFSEQTDLDGLISKTDEYQISNANYMVQYVIPNNFELQEYNSKQGMYKFKDKNIQLNTSILKCNIYEYLNEENSPNVYENYNLNNYNKEKAELNKFTNEPLSYIYKNSYLTNNQLTENITVMYELNNDHIFIVKISAEGIGITEKLVNTIKINKFENIASNITVEKNQENIIGKLKKYTDYTKQKIEEITLKIPENYQEIDRENNLFAERYYGANYNEEKEIYELQVKYETISFGIESKLETLDKITYKDYGEYEEFKQIDDININDKTFKVYKRGYIEQSSIKDTNGNKYQYHVNEKVLFYKIQDNDYCVIILKACGGEITDEMINQLTDFDINIIENK